MPLMLRGSWARAMPAKRDRARRWVFIRTAKLKSATPTTTVCHAKRKSLKYAPDHSKSPPMSGTAFATNGFGFILAQCLAVTCARRKFPCLRGCFFVERGEVCIRAEGGRDRRAACPGLFLRAGAAAALVRKKHGPFIGRLPQSVAEWLAAVSQRASHVQGFT